MQRKRDVMEAYYRAGQRVSRRNTSIREQLWCARGKRGNLSYKGEKEDSAGRTRKYKVKLIIEFTEYPREDIW